MFKIKIKKLNILATMVAMFAAASCSSVSIFSVNGANNNKIFENVQPVNANNNEIFENVKPVNANNNEEELKKIELIYDIADQFYNDKYETQFKELLNSANEVKNVLSDENADESVKYAKSKENFDNITQKLSELNLSENSELKKNCDGFLEKINSQQSISGELKNELLEFVKVLNERYGELKNFYENYFKKNFLDGSYNQTIKIFDGRDLHFMLTREKEVEENQNKDDVDPDYFSLSLSVLPDDEQTFNLENVAAIVDGSGIVIYPGLKLNIYDKADNELLFSNSLIKKPVPSIAPDVPPSSQWYCAGKLRTNARSIENSKNYSFVISYQPDPNSDETKNLFEGPVRLGEFERFKDDDPQVKFMFLSLLRAYLNGKI